MGAVFVELDHWSYFGYALTIRIIFMVRYNILHKWTETFSKLSKIDQRDRGTFFSKPNFAYKKHLNSFKTAVIIGKSVRALLAR